MNLNFTTINVDLIGDFMVDHYIFGESNRISPEAPVPVIIPQKELFSPGGAGNVALNLKKLGANVNCYGFVGNDLYGKNLILRLEKEGINCDNIEIINDHQTTIKQRIYLNDKQISRLDKEVIFNGWTPNYNFTNHRDSLLILSDYNKGALENVRILNQDNLSIVDPKKENFSLYRNATIITPNLEEISKALHCNPNDLKTIYKSCLTLIKKNNFKYIVLKKGAKGITIFDEKNNITEINGHSVLKSDVTGAGDTVIATLSLAYKFSKDIELSSKLANYAASLAVSKLGTAYVSIEEINHYIK